MKKRAVLSTFASLALAGAMCAGFASCGSETAESIKGEEVTAEQWAAAFGEESLANFKVEMESEASNEYEGFSSEGTQKTVVSIVGEKQYVTGKISAKVKGEVPDELKETFKDVDLGFDYYYDGENSKYIDEINGAWTYVTGNSEIPYMHAGIIMEELIFSNNYEDYEYSADKNGYVLKEERAKESYVVKFKDGKLKAALRTKTVESVGVKITSTMSAIFTFGGQEVTLPAVAE